MDDNQEDDEEDSKFQCKSNSIPNRFLIITKNADSCDNLIYSFEKYYRDKVLKGDKVDGLVRISESYDKEINKKYGLEKLAGTDKLKENIKIHDK